jgi:hypothetical protein
MISVDFLLWFYFYRKTCWHCFGYIQCTIFIASLLNKIIASIVCNLISTTVILNVWSTDCPLHFHTIFEQNENADVTIKVAMTQDSVGDRRNFCQGEMVEWQWMLEFLQTGCRTFFRFGGFLCLLTCIWTETRICTYGLGSRCVFKQ